MPHCPLTVWRVLALLLVLLLLIVRLRAYALALWRAEAVEVVAVPA